MKSNINLELYSELLRDGKILHSNIKPPYGNNIHPEYTSNRYYEPSNRSFNIYYLKSSEFQNDIKKNPLFLGYIPPQIYNENDIWNLIQTNPISIINFDESYIQPNMYATAIMLEPRLIGLLNERFQTIEIVSEVVKRQPMSLQFIRDDLKYYYICQAAVSLDWRAIEFVPQDIIDSRLVDLAKEDQDAFLLDKIDRSKLDADFYINQLVRFPIEGATHLIAVNLINNPDRVAELIYFIENLDAYGPQFIFDNCDPKILMHHDKYEAFVYLMMERPQWIEYLKPHFVTNDILEIALKNNIYPKLDSANWTGELVATTFTVNKKGYINIPYNRLSTLGTTRIKETIEEAIDERWINEIPKYFFTDEVVNDLDLREKLIGYRDSFAYIVTQGHKLDWDRLINLDCSVAEFRMLKQPIPTELSESFFDKQIESYVALTDEYKSKDRTRIFLNTYPDEIRSVPKRLQVDLPFMLSLIKENPIIGRYINLSELVNLIDIDS